MEARASADANSYWASLGASAGAMWLLDAFSTYASAHPIDPATIASAAPTSVELTGTLLAPPQLAPVPGGWAALVLEAAGPSLRAFAPDLTRVGTDLVLASGSVRVPRLTPTCGGNLLATWSTTTHSFAAPIGPALHALAPPVPTPVPARSGPYQQAAAFDGQHVLVPTSDGFAAFEADGAPAYQQPFPDVSSAFRDRRRSGRPPALRRGPARADRARRSVDRRRAARARAGPGGRDRRARGRGGAAHGGHRRALARLPADVLRPARLDHGGRARLPLSEVRGPTRRPRA
ncbi:MAG: hypothetical protein M5U28_41650 [Sandaracinaceae bacterium]|nr:hypothetical protein [Sandaracinaceae bacterium]